uniref:Uncharacterized protein n=1 Tax=Neobodo designis TaxID=312471 RepID=A0A7S1QK24_NEODS|mmetsp:Transcript_47288/g.145871  ORF Transcript_47288/g.145871 Transcript_47288/m.145871 type:complete len:157 (+) Transcript_47288:44-514(+)
MSARLVVLVAAFAVLWGLAMQAYVAFDTWATDAKITHMKQEADGLATDDAARARLDGLWKAKRQAVLDAIVRLAEDEGATLAALSRDCEAMRARLEGKDQSALERADSNAASESADGLLRELLRGAEAASVGADADGRAASTADLRDVDGIIDAAR